MKRVFVAGGASIDISGYPKGVCRLRDSNIGSVYLGVGGVGHNIAKRLTAYEDIAVELMTVLGSDERARLIEAACAAGGIGMRYALHTEGASAAYLCIHDEENDLLCGINDMDILFRLTPEFIAPQLPLLNAADMVVLDANLSEEALQYLAANVSAPLFYDPVSVAKCRRIGDLIGRCHAVKPNRFEAACLSGRSCDTVRGAYRAAEWFLEQGVGRVFISLGGEGVLWADAGGCGLVPAEDVVIRSTNGAGDAMCAAIIHGCMERHSAQQCAIDGNHASAVLCSAPDQEG